MRHQGLGRDALRMSKWPKLPCQEVGTHNHFDVLTVHYELRDSRKKIH